MMNQLTALMMIIGLELFKINKSLAVIMNYYIFNAALYGKRVIITKAVDDSI